jgi:hypothetical protein
MLTKYFGDDIALYLNSMLKEKSGLIILLIFSLRSEERIVRLNRDLEQIFLLFRLVHQLLSILSKFLLIT